jgi:hypothetical protein
MPAYTIAQLSSMLAIGEYNYVAPGGSFTQALSQVLPRIMAMGLWRDTVYEVSLPNKYGYVSLPADTDTVLAATVNGRARAVRSMWHDIRITGRHAVMSAYYGVVDDGWHPVLLDMKEVQDMDTEDDVTGVSEINVFYPGTTTAVLVTDFTGQINIRVRTSATTGSVGDMDASTLGDYNFSIGGDGYFGVESITYTDVPFPVDLTSSFDDTKVIATVPAGSGVLRFRRFRTSQPSEESYVHLLVKRAAPMNLTDDTIIYLGNIGAIKHGLLGLIAEDNADIERAGFHWGMCGKLLDEELRSILGAAKPTLNVDLSGSGSALPIYNQF